MPKLTPNQETWIKTIGKEERDHDLGYYLMFVSRRAERAIMRLERRGLVDATTDPRYAVLTQAGRAALEDLKGRA